MANDGFKAYQLAKIGDYRGLKSVTNLEIYNYTNEDEYDNNLLFAAIDSRNADVILFVMSNTINLDYQNKLGWTALHKAVRMGSWKVVSEFLRRSANPNIKDNFGESPIHVAAIKGHEKILKLLLNNKADPNIKDNSGWTPISFAAMQGHSSLVKLLLLNGADIDVQDYNGNTPLHHLSINDSYDGIKILIENDANVTIKNEEGLTAYEYAEKCRRPNAMKIFTKYGLLLQSNFTPGDFCRNSQSEF